MFNKNVVFKYLTLKNKNTDFYNSVLFLLKISYAF